MKGKVLLLLLVVLLCVALVAGCTTGTNGKDESSEDANKAGEEIKFPEKEIKLIVPHGTGGAADLISRIMAKELEEYLGVPIIVEPMPGANTAIGNTFVANAPADGYTMMLYSEPTTYISTIAQEVSYSTDDFVGVGCMNMDPGFLAVAIDSPYKTIEDVIAASKEKKLKVGLSQMYGIHAYCTQRMAETLGIENLVLVPYDSAAEQTTALMGKHVDLAGKAGGYDKDHGTTVRILATAWDERLPNIPDVPTVKELTGEDLKIMALRGLSVHKDTPPERLKVLRDAFDHVIKNEEVKKSIESLGNGFINMTGEEFDAANKELQKQVSERRDLFTESSK